MRPPKHWQKPPYGEAFVDLKEAVASYSITHKDRVSILPERAWRNKDFLVQLYAERGHQRLTIQRIEGFDPNGYGRGEITWDELQQVKNGVGFGDTWAIEIYPADGEVVNVCAMRHLWLLTEAPPQAWVRKKEKVVA